MPPISFYKPASHILPTPSVRVVIASDMNVFNKIGQSNNDWTGPQAKERYFKVLCPSPACLLLLACPPSRLPTCLFTTTTLRCVIWCTESTSSR